MSEHGFEFKFLDSKVNVYSPSSPDFWCNLVKAIKKILQIIHLASLKVGFLHTNIYRLGEKKTEISLASLSFPCSLHLALMDSKSVT